MILILMTELLKPSISRASYNVVYSKLISHNALSLLRIGTYTTERAQIYPSLTTYIAECWIQIIIDTLQYRGNLIK